MNILEMREAVQLNIDDITGDLYTTAQINSILVRAFNHIYRKAIDANVSPNVDNISLTFSANTQEVLIGNAGIPIIISNLQRAIYCKDSSNEEIPILDFEASVKSDNRSVYVRRNFTEGRPEQHYLGYHVTPSSGFTVTLYFIPKIINSLAGLEDSTIIGYIPEEHHDVVINYATILLLGRDEINAAFWFQMYTESLRDMLATLANESKKYQGVVDVSENEDWV